MLEVRAGRCPIAGDAHDSQCICVSVCVVVDTQPTGGSAADMAGTDYTTAVDITDLESLLSGASEVSCINWEEVDLLVGEVN